MQSVGAIEHIEWTNFIIVVLREIVQVFVPLLGPGVMVKLPQCVGTGRVLEVYGDGKRTRDHFPSSCTDICKMHTYICTIFISQSPSVQWQ
jgi:hypothetical protein